MLQDSNIKRRQRRITLDQGWSMLRCFYKDALIRNFQHGTIDMYMIKIC